MAGSNYYPDCLSSGLSDFSTPLVSMTYTCHLFPGYMNERWCHGYVCIIMYDLKVTFQFNQSVNVWSIKVMIAEWIIKAYVLETLCPGGGHCTQNAHKARPNNTFWRMFLSWLGWQWISYRGGSFRVVDECLGWTFVCTTRASERGIIMDTGITDLSSEQTYIVTNYM